MLLGDLVESFVSTKIGHFSNCWQKKGPGKNWIPFGPKIREGKEVIPRFIPRGLGHS